METQPITIQKSPKPGVKERNLADLPFGQLPTDHMFVAAYQAEAWENAGIVPFKELSLSPFALCLHYGQTVFEGMKAYRMADGYISIFRPEKYHQRLNKSLQRICMPQVSWELFMEGLTQLVIVDQEWVPSGVGSSLYIRPFVIATEARLGVKTSDEYLFIIVACPVNSFYSHNLKVKVETTYIRAAEGGTGYAKCGGNYAASFYPTHLAKEEGFDQVLWTDGREKEYIEESGMMNIMFVWENRLVTPPLSSSILDGVTRDSILTLAKDLGLQTEERKISVHELEERLQNGSLTEAFGVGTAAVVAPIEQIAIREKRYTVPVKEDSFMLTAKRLLSDIWLGLIEDKHTWNYVISIK